MAPNNPRLSRLRVVTLGIVILVAGHGVLALPTADFELRLAPSSPDAVLDLNNPADQQLDLELWITLGNGPLPSNVFGYSFQLVPSAHDVISYKAGSFTNVLPFDPPVVNGIDNQSASNQPLSGAFGRALFTFSQPNGVPFPLLQPVKVATFSVTAQGLGQVGYFFQASPPIRPWTVSFAEYDIAGRALASPAMTITVIPEPVPAALIMLCLGWVARRSNRYGRRQAVCIS